MKVITDIFMTVLGMSLTATYCICAVCVLRILMKRLPKIFSYVLWSVVAIRLICPVLPESSFSLMGDRVAESAQWIAGYDSAMYYDTEEVPAIPDAIEASELKAEVGGADTENSISSRENIGSGVDRAAQSSAVGDDSVTGTDMVYGLCSVIWLGVFIALCTYNLISYLRLKKRLKHRPSIVETPFVLGIMHPIIYLPDGLTEEERIQCMSHERVHIQRKDYLIKQFAFILACIHWFNPFVWLAFYLMSQDMEMSCDERALQSPALADRRAYSGVLLKLSTEKVRFGGYPIAFGESSAASRIKNIMNYKKPAFWSVLILCAGIAVCLTGLFTNPVKVKGVDGMTDTNIVDISAGNSTDRAGNRKLSKAEYEKQLLQIMQKRIKTKYENLLGSNAASMKTITREYEKTTKAIEKIMQQINAEQEKSVIVGLQEELSEQKEILAFLTGSKTKFANDREEYLTCLNQLGEPNTAGRTIPTQKSATKFLNLPENNCLLTHNFNMEQIDLCDGGPSYDDIWSDSSKNVETGNGEQGSTTEEDILYVRVECTEVFYYYNGMIRLDYRNADEEAVKQPDCPLIQGSVYLAPKNAQSDMFHLDSNYIVGNVIHEGGLKDKDASHAFDLSEFLDTLYSNSK